MKIKKVYVGSWYPRTLFHLNEMHNFLANGESHLHLDKEKLLNLKKDLNPTNVVLKQDKGHSYLQATFGDYKYESRENGLSFFSCPCIHQGKDIDNKLEKMSEFAFKKVFASFSYIYSLGAPIPKIFSALKSIMPYVFITENGTREEIVEFLKRRGEKITKEFSNEKIEVYYGHTCIVIDGEIEYAEKIVKECIYYLHDAEAQFQKILDLHRYIWNEVSDIKSSKSIKYKDLASTRDLLTEIESDVIYFESRINQIKNVLIIQKQRVSEFANQDDDYIWKVFEDGFNSLLDSSDYVENLWKMTKDYLTGASDLISLIYQESSNKQINNLQFVFIISAISSILALGSIVSSNLIGVVNLDTGIVSATLHSFSWTDFTYLGLVSILSGSLLYYVWDKVYRNYAGSKISDPNLINRSKFSKIKQMFN